MQSRISGPLGLLLVSLLVAAPATAEPSLCGRHDVAVEILGSGGPMHGEGRGGAAYLLWYAHRPQVVVDMGGDTPEKLARSGVKAGDVPLLLISHLHPDHVSGLADFLWGEITGLRHAPLTLAGPTGGGAGFPAVDDFVRRQFGTNGLYPRMQGMFEGTPFLLTLKVVSAQQGVLTRFAAPPLSVSAYGVDHGPAPALAWRVDGPGFRIVFGGDQTYADPGFSHFAERADLLLMHAIVTRDASSSLAQSVGVPEQLGRRAAEAKARRVVLSHLMQATAQSADALMWSLSDLAGVEADMRKFFAGPIALAKDGDCLTVR